MEDTSDMWKFYDKRRAFTVCRVNIYAALMQGYYLVRKSHADAVALDICLVVAAIEKGEQFFLVGVGHTDAVVRKDVLR